MRRKFLGIVLTVIVLALTISILSSHRVSEEAEPQAVQFTTPESEGVPINGSSIRRFDDPIKFFAKSSVPPEYPAGPAGKRRTGIVVVEIRLDSSFQLTGVEILQEPSPEFGKAVSAAISHWSFGRPDGFTTTAETFSGTATFYFYASGGAYRGAGPLEAPNLRTADAVFRP